MKHNFLSLLLVGTIISVGTISTSACFAKDKPLPPAIEEPFAKPDFDPIKAQKKMAEKMAKELDLSKEQQERAHHIHEKGRAEIEPLMHQMKDLREKIDAKRRANMEEFESILTPDQKHKFEKMKKHNSHKMKKGKHEKFPPKPEKPHDKPQI